MSKGALVVIAVTIIGGIVMFFQDKEKSAAAAERAKTQHVEQALAIIAKLVYVKAPSTNVCFGYGWDDRASAGLVLVQVPCEIVGL